MTGNNQHEAAQPVIIENAATATFECTYGRGCDGICCQNGRPPVTQTESARINANIEKFLPELRPEARELVEAQGYLSRRGLPDQPMLRVIGGWCVFFNKGCILHRIGATEGDKYRYKPLPCSLFPIAKDAKDRWQVRQKDYQREAWDLFCLDPKATHIRAVDALQEEMALIRTVEAEAGKSREEK